MILVKNVLVNARKAFDAGELQIQKEPKMIECRYSGPCAIGVSLPKVPEGYDGMDVYTLHATGFFETDNINDLMVLQNAHDAGTIEYFERTLEELELKYAEA